MRRSGIGPLAIIGPGLLVAATGVGAGDLATAGFTGAMLGVGVAWAILLGALLKYVLTEGLARWQLVTNSTLLEGVGRHIGRWALILFILYLIPFSYVVGGALISACGITTQSIVPLGLDPVVGKVVYGGVISAGGLGLAWIGGFRFFERVMAVCIAVMFLAVLVTAVMLVPDWGELVAGLVTSPTIPRPTEESFTWTLSLLGGVGGTVTLLCYGYWIRQQGRSGTEWIRTCRIDLIVGYTFTAAFGVAMLVIATGTEPSSRGANLIIELAGRLESSLGSWARWVFLVGSWAAVTSSLLGVWQAVPMLFADAWRSVVGLRKLPADELVRTRSARVFLILMATLPILQAWQAFKQVQMVYAVLGAFFLPLLAIVLLWLNGRARTMDQGHRNGPLTTSLLLLTLAIFVTYGWFKLR